MTTLSCLSCCMTIALQLKPVVISAGCARILNLACCSSSMLHTCHHETAKIFKLTKLKGMAFAIS